MLQLSGAYLFFGAQVVIHRQEMRARVRQLPDGALTRLELSDAAWEKAHIEEDELELDGRMWDIARVAREGNRWVVFAIRDAHEENLWSWLEWLLQAEGDSKHPPLPLIKLFASKFVPSQIIVPVNGFRLVANNSRYLLMQSDFEPGILSPPPRNPPFAYW